MEVAIGRPPTRRVSVFVILAQWQGFLPSLVRPHNHREQRHLFQSTPSCVHANMRTIRERNKSTTTVVTENKTYKTVKTPNRASEGMTAPF